MVKLESADRSRLVTLLESLPRLQTTRERRLLLLAAGLENVIPHIDLEGPPFVVISDIVYHLERFGKLSYHHEALGAFLNVIKDVAVDETERNFIDMVLIKYQLMAPAKHEPEPATWNSIASAEDVFEQIIGENTLRHIAFLQRGLDVARSVALVDVGPWTGTGFLISTKLLLTNHHVLPNQTFLDDTCFRFNYQQTFDGAEEKVQDYRANPEGIFLTNQELDYSIVEIADEPGKDWGVTILSPAIPAVDSRVNILQHPYGLPKQISFQNNFVKYADAQIVQYVASTAKGSSGSPICDDRWRVLALHHAGGLLIEPGTKRKYMRNEGIAMRAILQDLPASIRQQLFVQ